jgi:hypothetical protein
MRSTSPTTASSVWQRLRITATATPLSMSA